ncbi:hypothetical protein CLAIMM_03273, partial [Cladophialophora immunda]
RRDVYPIKTRPEPLREADYTNGAMGILIGNARSDHDIVPWCVLCRVALPGTLLFPPYRFSLAQPNCRAGIMAGSRACRDFSVAHMQATPGEGNVMVHGEWLEETSL